MLKDTSLPELHGIRSRMHIYYGAGIGCTQETEGIDFEIERRCGLEPVEIECWCGLEPVYPREEQLDHWTWTEPVGQV